MPSQASLLKKYNIPGPRYTSYPTVPYWVDSPTPEQWIQSIARALDESEKQDIGAALYIHIPFCESLCTYCGCNTRITRKHSVGNPYVDTLLKEWDLYLSQLNRKVTLSEIHLGGGTPTFLSAEELTRLMEGILSRVKVHRSAEFSVETDPRVTRMDHLKALYQLGFRRLSLGVQDFDPRVQEAVHRVQSEQLVREITENARTVGYTGINYDLIYGLPFQVRSSVENTIRTVCQLKPDRIAFYSYAHVPWIRPGQRRFTEADVPVGDAKRELYEIGRILFEENGYKEIGMDHFALPSDSLWRANLNGSLHRNFMGYTTRQVSPLIALGVSAIGDSWGVFAQNEKLLETYQSRVEQGIIPIFRGHALSEEDLVLRRHILNLMTKMETHWNEPSAQTDYLENVHERLRELEGDELIQLTGQSCKITEKGRPFLRNICMAFDARLIRKAPTTQLFSQTI